VLSWAAVKFPCPSLINMTALLSSAVPSQIRSRSPSPSISLLISLPGSRLLVIKLNLPILRFANLTSTILIAPLERSGRCQLRNRYQKSAKTRELDTSRFWNVSELLSQTEVLKPHGAHNCVASAISTAVIAFL